MSQDHWESVAQTAAPAGACMERQDLVGMKSDAATLEGRLAIHHETEHSYPTIQQLDSLVFT